MKKYKMKKWFVDTAIGFTVLVITTITLAVAITVILTLSLVKISQEISCNQVVENQPQLVEGDYKVWADECFVTTQNDQIIPWSKYRPVSEIE